MPKKLEKPPLTYENALKDALQMVRDLKPGVQVSIKRSEGDENSEFVISGPVHPKVSEGNAS